MRTQCSFTPSEQLAGGQQFFCNILTAAGGKAIVVVLPSPSLVDLPTLVANQEPLGNSLFS